MLENLLFFLDTNLFLFGAHLSFEIILTSLSHINFLRPQNYEELYTYVYFTTPKIADPSEILSFTNKINSRILEFSEFSEFCMEKKNLNGFSFLLLYIS